jgi:hypothetical protein
MCHPLRSCEVSVVRLLGAGQINCDLFAEDLLRSLVPVASTCRPVEQEEVRREMRAVSLCS